MTGLTNITKEQMARQLALGEAREKDIQAKLNKALEANQTPASVISLADLTKVLLGAGDTLLDPLDLLARLGVKVPTSFSVTVNFTVTGKEVRIFESDITNWELQNAWLCPVSERPILSKDLEFTDFNVVVINPINAEDVAHQFPLPKSDPKPEEPNKAPPAQPRIVSAAEQWTNIQEGK